IEEAVRHKSAAGGRGWSVLAKPRFVHTRHRAQVWRRRRLPACPIRQRWLCRASPRQRAIACPTTDAPVAEQYPINAGQHHRRPHRILPCRRSYTTNLTKRRRTSFANEARIALTTAERIRSLRFHPPFPLVRSKYLFILICTRAGLPERRISSR